MNATNELKGYVGSTVCIGGGIRGVVRRVGDALDGTGRDHLWVTVDRDEYSRRPRLAYLEEIQETASGWAVRRCDGAIAEFIDRADAEEALARLASGDASNGDYEWLEVQ